MDTFIPAVLFSLSIFLVPVRGETSHFVVEAVDPTVPRTIVIGFVGGFVKHDNLVHSEVQVAAHLRKDYSPGVYVQVFENYHRKKAYHEILRLLDTDQNGALSKEEKLNARIILYGHSWGASEAITLARTLQKDGVPVLLTIQLDSVSKMHQNDSIIPANVAQAANFYQTKGVLHGRSYIRAADPDHTRIIGNFQFDYQASSLNCVKYPWFDRIFVKPHTQIECDPRVWTQVEDLIRSELPPIKESGSATIN